MEYRNDKKPITGIKCALYGVVFGALGMCAGLGLGEYKHSQSKEGYEIRIERLEDQIDAQNDIIDAQEIIIRQNFPDYPED